jgi:hypothetical protein
MCLRFAFLFITSVPRIHTVSRRRPLPPPPRGSRAEIVRSTMRYFWVP